MSYRDTIKQYFETGDYPTQAQFWEFFDKIPFLDEGFASRITAIGQSQIAIPAGAEVDKIRIRSNTVISVSCGHVAGSDDVFSNEQVNTSLAIDVDLDFLAAGTLYFTNITPTTTIIIFIR